MRPKDTLQLISYEEYGSPSHWRRIAEANAIDDPLNLRVGEALAIPPLS